jgi:hypothetical protein
VNRGDDPVSERGAATQSIGGVVGVVVRLDGCFEFRGEEVVVAVVLRESDAPVWCFKSVGAERCGDLENRGRTKVMESALGLGLVGWLGLRVM